MPDAVYLTVIQQVVKVVEVSRQGLPGPPGEGMTPEIVAAIEGANAPSAENPFVTQQELPNSPEEVVAEHEAKADPHAQYAKLTDLAQALADLVGSSPAALDTLVELATALGNNPNFATTITNALAGKEPTLATMTQEQAENPADTTKAATTGQRIWQAITKALVTTTSIFSGILKGYSETEHTLTSAAGAVTVTKANGNVQRLALTETVTSWTFPALEAGKTLSFTLKIVGNGSAGVSWGGVTIDWQTSTNSDDPPSLATGNGYVSTVTFISDQASNRWLGYFCGKETF